MPSPSEVDTAMVRTLAAQAKPSAPVAAAMLMDLCDALDAARAEAADERSAGESWLVQWRFDLDEVTARAELAEAAIARVRALADGWIGFDDSHTYGDAVLLAILGEDPAS